jgi:arylsulfatase A-like enzyme
VIDTLRADRLHVAGNPAPVSPNLDALAAQGLWFERAYAASAWTVPSTASLLCGLPPPAHGVGFGDSYYLADALLTLGEAFQRAGYTTAGFSCNPLIAASRGFDQGFETFLDTSWSRATAVHEEVRDFLRQAADKRFFLYLHYVEPHWVYEPTEEARALLAGPPPPGYLDVELDKHLPAFYADPDADLERLLATRDHQLRLYDAEILDVDREIGRVLALLRELGVADRTVIAVTSDHGEEFLENGWAGHHNQLFDGTTRVPLLLHGPGVPVGKVVGHPVENRHLAATLLALAGVPATENLRGPNLSDPLELARLEGAPVFMTNTKGRLADLDARWQRPLGQIHSVIHQGWRLVWEPERGPGEGGHLSLHRLLEDPDCRVDEAAREPARVEALRELVLRWIDENQARQPARMGATAATRELMREIGYLGQDE